MGDLQPGMRLTKINGVALPASAGTDSIDPRSVAGAQRLRKALVESQGEPVRAAFADSTGREVEAALAAEPRYQVGIIKRGEEELVSRHLLGLVPVMRVVATQERAEAAGLLPGDVFARIGSVEWPSVAAGIAEVRAHRGRDVELTVLRDGAIVTLSASVNSKGLIGFAPGDTADEYAIIASAPGLRPRAAKKDPTASPFPAERILPALLPGSRITAVAGRPVSNFRDLRAALILATAGATADEAVVPLDVELSIKNDAGAPRVDRFSLPLTRADVESLRTLGWDPSSIMYNFRIAEFTDRATGPINAIAKGVKKTHYVVMMTYVTFLRLFQGTVPVSQLHGPVGITHLGSQVAERGFIYVLFFLGLISANLAVINFLPLPIFDGGHVVFLAIEAITRRPVSAGVQSAAIVAGLVLIVTVFLVVTFNDLARLFG
jgi:regulator of sigma E protease